MRAQLRYDGRRVCVRSRPGRDCAEAFNVCRSTRRAGDLHKTAGETPSRTGHAIFAGIRSAVRLARARRGKAGRGGLAFGEDPEAEGRRGVTCIAVIAYLSEPQP
jgi:hypothetical protein